MSRRAAQPAQRTLCGETILRTREAAPRCSSHDCSCLAIWKGKKIAWSLAFDKRREIFQPATKLAHDDYQRVRKIFAALRISTPRQRPAERFSVVALYGSWWRAGIQTPVSELPWPLQGRFKITEA
jgi:hypothetical protein